MPSKSSLAESLVAALLSLVLVVVSLAVGFVTSIVSSESSYAHDDLAVALAFAGLGAAAVAFVHAVRRRVVTAMWCWLGSAGAIGVSVVIHAAGT